MSYHSALGGSWRAVLGFLEELAKPLTLGTYHAALQAVQAESAWPCGLQLLQASEAHRSLISYNLAIQGLEWQRALALLGLVRQRQLQPASLLLDAQ